MRAVKDVFSGGMFPTFRNISLCSEPEACALFTAQDARMRDSFNVNRVCEYTALIRGTFHKTNSKC
jgi:hypothetical protein